jgi:demethylmenaquinone methyltransferase/2-methoxy-6-polyprenyl-1,4-benzoquinol methylase
MNKGIRKIFMEVPRTYELVNHVLTGGADILWRRRAARLAAAKGGARWLDVCTGTGEMAIYLRRLAPAETAVFAADFCPPMALEAMAKPEAKEIIFLLADAGSLPFPDESFDLITISFATRNINVSREHLMKCLREFHRLLRPSGRFVNLETSQPRLKLFRKLMHFFVALVVKPVGSSISGSDASYAYLSHTIPRFYGAEELAGIFNEAGFSKVVFRQLMFGAAAIHESVK